MLEALYPGRIDLGIGRAPGTDQVTALALRRSVEALSAEDFPEQLVDLQDYFAGTYGDGHPYRQHPGGPGGGQLARPVAAGIQRLQRPARRHAGIALRLRSPFQLRQHASRRWRCTGGPSALRGAGRAVLPHQGVGAVRRRTPTKRTGCTVRPACRCCAFGPAGRPRCRVRTRRRATRYSAAEQAVIAEAHGSHVVGDPATVVGRARPAGRRHRRRRADGDHQHLRSRRPAAQLPSCSPEADARGPGRASRQSALAEVSLARGRFLNRSAMPAVPVRPGIPPKVCGSRRMVHRLRETPTARCRPSRRRPGRTPRCPSSTSSSDSDGGLMAGPITSELVGIDGRPHRERRADTGEGSRISRRFRAYRSRAVSGFKPKVDSISARLEQCSNGPSCTTWCGRARLDTTMRGDPEAELPVVRDELAVGRGGAVAGVHDVGRVGVVDDPRRGHVVVEAAPLVERHDEDGVVEVTVVGQGVIGVGDEPFAEPDVAQRVVVARTSRSPRCRRRDRCSRRSATCRSRRPRRTTCRPTARPLRRPRRRRDGRTPGT